MQKIRGISLLEGKIYRGDSEMLKKIPSLTALLLTLLLIVTDVVYASCSEIDILPENEISTEFIEEVATEKPTEEQEECEIEIESEDSVESSEVSSELEEANTEELPSTEGDLTVSEEENMEASEEENELETKEELTEIVESELVWREITTTVSGASIVISGQVPEEATIEVEKQTDLASYEESVNEKSVNSAVYGVNEAFDIKIMLNGEQWQPLENDTVVNITITGIDVTEVVSVFRLDDDSVTELNLTKSEDRITFETEHFTVFALVSMNTVVSTFTVSVPASVLLELDTDDGLLKGNIPLNVQYNFPDESCFVSVVATSAGINEVVTNKNIPVIIEQPKCIWRITDADAQLQDDGLFHSETTITVTALGDVGTFAGTVDFIITGNE